MFLFLNLPTANMQELFRERLLRSALREKKLWKTQIKELKNSKGETGENVFWKNAANLQEKTEADVWFQ